MASGLNHHGDIGAQQRGPIQFAGAFVKLGQMHRAKFANPQQYARGCAQGQRCVPQIGQGARNLLRRAGGWGLQNRVLVLRPERYVPTLAGPQGTGDIAPQSCAAAHRVNHALHIIGVCIGGDAMAQVENMWPMAQGLYDGAGCIHQRRPTRDHMR